MLVASWWAVQHTRNKLLFDTYVCKQQTTPWNTICCGISLSARYIYVVYFSIMSTIVICTYVSCRKAWETSQLKHAATYVATKN